MSALHKPKKPNTKGLIGLRQVADTFVLLLNSILLGPFKLVTKKGGKFRLNAISYINPIKDISHYTVQLILTIGDLFKNIFTLIVISSKPARKVEKTVKYSRPKQKPGLFHFIKWLIKRFFSIEFRVKIFSIKTIILLIIFSGIYVVSVYYLAILTELPSPNRLLRKDSKLTTNIYDRKGNILYQIYVDEDRELLKLNEIPQNLINATVAIEDQDFFEHKGLSLRGIARAAKKTILEDDLEGGSTITQQLVKNTLLQKTKNERTMERKTKEALLAIQVELQFSKEEILQMYLNEIPYGGTAYGIQSAAHKYFGKNAQDLTLAESSLLAGLPAAPSLFSPLMSSPEYAKARQKDVLNRMVSEGYITSEEAQQAYLEELVYKEQKTPIKYPHFVNYTKSYLVDKYGQQLVEQGGLEVYTSIDQELQKMLEESVKNNINLLSRYNVHNGAAMITNPKTGEILAMVGSVDYWNTANDGNVNVTTAPRQPGSSIKPLTYSLAFENGYSPNNTIKDEPMKYDIPGQVPYVPVNYDGKFHGLVTLKSALANSYNIPAVKLLDKLGIDNFIAHAKRMGITTWDNQNNRFGLSLTLGAGEVKMTDMATAYGIFANQGKKIEITPLLKVYDSFGDTIYSNDCVDLLGKKENSILSYRALFEAKASSDYNGIANANACKGEQIISPESAYFITEILSDNKARIPAFGANSSLNVTAKPVAVKTGTTQNLKDNWAIGYLGDYVVLTWIGNNDGEVMGDVVSGYRGATNIWRDAVDYLIANRDIPDAITKPDSIIEVSICPLTNTLACDGCPNIKALYKKGEEPKIHCNPDTVRKIIEEKNAPKENKTKDE